MYTNTFLHFLLAYNQVKQGLRTSDYRYTVATVPRLKKLQLLTLYGPNFFFRRFSGHNLR